MTNKQEKKTVSIRRISVEVNISAYVTTDGMKYYNWHDAKLHQNFINEQSTTILLYGLGR